MLLHAFRWSVACLTGGIQAGVDLGVPGNLLDNDCRHVRYCIPVTECYRLEEANRALRELRSGGVRGAKVLVVSEEE